MPRPLVSVLLPVHNAGSFLPACLESLAGQSLTSFEIVAVDDGSTDESRDVLERWRRRDPRLRILDREHSGLVETLNHGLDACRSELVARMDADDRSHPQRLELQAAALVDDPGLDVVSCRVRHFSTAGPVGPGYRIYEQWLNGLTRHEDILRERFVESPLPHPSVMVRRAALTRAGGYRDRGWPEDYDLWLRLIERGCHFAKIDRVLLDWREHPDRLTRRDRRYAVERFLECKAHFLVRGPLATEPRLLIWGAGQTGRRLSKHLIRGNRRPDAFIDIDPAKWGRTVRGVSVERPQALADLFDPGTSVVLAAVASRGARGKIRGHLDGLSLVEGSDYWCVA